MDEWDYNYVPPKDSPKLPRLHPDLIDLLNRYRWNTLINWKRVEWSANKKKERKKKMKKSFCKKCGHQKTVLDKHFKCCHNCDWHSKKKKSHNHIMDDLISLYPALKDEYAKTGKITPESILRQTPPIFENEDDFEKLMQD